MLTRKWMCLTVLLVLAFTAFAHAQTPVRNLLQDGSFESMAPELHQWTDKPDGGGGSWAIMETNGAPDGRHIFRMISWGGSHTFFSPTFTPKTNTVSLSLFLRDNGLVNGWGTRLPEGKATFSWGLRNVQTAEEIPLINGAVPDNTDWTRLTSAPQAVQAGAQYQVFFMFNPYAGNQLVDLDAVQVEDGGEVTAFAGRPYVYKFIEAEDLQFAADSGWRAVEGNGADIYDPVSADHVLVGGNNAQPASSTVDIPAEGDYTLDVKLLKQNRYQSPFRGVVEQNGQVLLDEWFHVTNRPGDRNDGYWYWRWELGKAAAHLLPGTATISLIPGPGPADMEQTSYGGRNLDCVLLTTDPAYQPNFQDFAPKVYLRVTATPSSAQPYYLKLRVSHQRAIVSVYEEPGFVSAGGFLPQPLGYIPTGKSTGWFDISRYLPGTLSTLAMDVVTEDGKPSAHVQATIEVSRSMTAEPFKTITESLDGDMLSVIVADDLAKYADWIIGPEELVARHEQMLAGLSLPESTRSRALTLESYFIGWGSAYKDPALRDRELTVLAKLGFNAMWGASLTPAVATPFGIDRLRQSDYVPYDYKAKAELPAFFSDYAAKSAKAWMDAIGAPPYFVCLGDENSSFFGRMAGNAAALADFRQWLEDKNLTAQDLGLASWGALSFIDRSETMTTGQKRLYYERCVFAHNYDGIYLGAATRAFEAAYPDPKPLTMLNYSPLILGDGSWTPNWPDWLTIGRLRGTTINWSEDWQSWNGWYVGEQLMSMICDIQRSAGRYHGQPVGMYAIYNTDPAHFERKVFSAVAHSAKTIAYYTYGPYPYTTEVSFSSSRDAMQRIATFNHQLGAVDDLISKGQPRKAQVAMLISEPSGVWKKTDGFAGDLRNIYLALLHSGVPVDFVEEADISNGVLGDYKVLYVTAPNLTRAAAEDIEVWVKRGGVIVTTAGSGLRDELDEPLNTLMPVFGLADQKMLADGNVGRDKLELPTLKPLDKVTMIARAPFNGASFDVLAARQALTPAQGAEVVGAYTDGTPAAVFNRYGKGQSLYIGALPGVAYLWSAKPTNTEPTVGFLTGPREVCAAGFALAGLRKPVEVSEPLVEAVVLESAKGLVIPLINWSEQKLASVTVRINQPGKFKQVGTVKHPTLKPKMVGESLEVTIPLEETDLLYVRR